MIATRAHNMSTRSTNPFGFGPTRATNGATPPFGRPPNTISGTGLGQSPSGADEQAEDADGLADNPPDEDEICGHEAVRLDVGWVVGETVGVFGLLVGT